MKAFMEESSLPANNYLRKRKRRSPFLSSSDSLIGIVTRSKSRMHFDHNRSSITRSGQVFGRPTSLRPGVESVEVVLEVNCNIASRVSAVKDLRSRRVSTPEVSLVLEEEAEEVENEQAKKKLKDSDGGLDSNRVSDPGVGHAMVDEPDKSEIVLAEAREEQNDAKNGLKDQAGNGSISRGKMALNRCGRRKVFKASSSFSYRRLLPYLTDIANDDSGLHKIEIVDARIPCKLQKLDGVNSEKVETEDVKYSPTKGPSNQQDLSGAENELGGFVENGRPSEVDRKGLENDLNKVRESIEEECGQTTPPDPDIFTRTGGESVEANNLLVKNQEFTVPSVGSEKGTDVVLRRSPNGKRSFDSGVVLNPCSRLRLFENPRSLSYRRLLPFLMDISKNNSSASRQMPQVDLKEDLRQVSTSTAELNSVNDGTEKLYKKRLTEDGSSPDTNNSPVSSMPQSSSMNESSKVEPSSVTPEALANGCTTINLQIERTPQPKSSPRKLEQGFNLKENPSPYFSMNNDILTKQTSSEESEPVGIPKMCSGPHNNKAESIEKVHLNRGSSHTEVSNAFVVPNNGPLKRILKKNRRGCRGLCSCLNCATFRLHADRAFEFSRSQMQDAEEVASDLMKELANLRLLLGKSIGNDNDLTAIQLNPVFIKQACDKALEAENVAKVRLSQLNDDLNAHCRIPVLVPPKVTFAANCIKERAIPALNPSS